MQGAGGEGPRGVRRDRRGRLARGRRHHPGLRDRPLAGRQAIYVEREGGVFKLRRGFAIPPGARVLMVEDIVTTGLSSRETLAAIAERPGTIVGAACIVDRSGGKADVGVPLVALATLDSPGLPARRAAAGTGGAAGRKPGSRALAGAA